MNIQLDIHDSEMLIEKRFSAKIVFVLFTRRLIIYFPIDNVFIRKKV